jgi:hypothetical protein
VLERLIFNKKILKFFNVKKSFTLAEVLIGIAFVVIIFFGIFSAFYSAFKILGLQQRKTTALQIAQGEIEKIRNLRYSDVGTIGAQAPYASGTLESSTSTILNGVVYNIERKIMYVYDPSDGEEPCPIDYKKVEIKVSFSGFLKGEVVLTTEVTPRDKVEEAAECDKQPVGVLSVKVFNAKGEFVQNPKIEIYSPTTSSLIISVTPTSGKYNFILSPGSYKVVVSKEGYSTKRTYSIEEIAIPAKPNPIVLQGQITEISFLIDRFSSMLVKTLSTWREEFFSDIFDDESKISQKENVTVTQGQATLATTTGGYYLSGYLFSVEISPQNLLEWGNFSFSDLKPQGTNLKYQIYYASGTDWILIPDSDLPGNSRGFNSSPVNLKNLSTTTYSKLKLKAIFSTNSTSLTPSLDSWQVSFKTSNSTPIPNVTFDLRGDKIIGKDSNENPIYKFSTTTQTDSQGQILLSNLEWDVYYFSNFKKDSKTLDLVTSTPPHPASLDPGTNLNVSLYLDSQNSLLVTVKDSETLNPIFSATTTLIAPGFSQIQYTDINGQTIFIPLNQGTYNLSVEAIGYSPSSTSVSVSGKSTVTIFLSPTD